MFVQNLKRIVSKPNVTPGQILYYTTDSIPIDLMFQENFPTHTQVWNRLSHRNDSQQRGVIWAPSRCYNSNRTRLRTSVNRRSSATHSWVSCVCSHPAGPRQLDTAQQDRAIESGNQQLRHVTHVWDQSFRAQQYLILRLGHCQVTKVPVQDPHITTEYSADSRNRTPWARISLHIQNPKPQASIKNKIVKFNKLFCVYNITLGRWFG